MKRIFIFVMLFAVLHGSAQTFKMEYKGTEILNGDTVTVVYPADFDRLNLLFIDIKNISESPITVETVFKHLWLGENVTSNFCFGECLPVNEEGNTGDVTIPQGTTISDQFELSYYTETPGTSGFFFLLRNSNNPQDSLSFSLIVDATRLNLQNKPVTISSFNAYPNPTAHKVCIQYSLSKETDSQTNILIRNIMGGVVRSIPVENRSGKITIDINDLSSGFYFYSLEFNGNILTTKKLIVE